MIFTTTQTTVNSFSQIVLRNRSSDVGGCRIVSINNGANSSDLSIVTGDTGEKVRIDASGNVYVSSGKFGVGNAATSTPSHLLTVQDSGASGLAKIYSTTGTVTDGQKILEIRADDDANPVAYDLLNVAQGDKERLVVTGEGDTTLKRWTAGNGTGANTVLTLAVDDQPTGTDMAAGDGTRLLFKIPAADTSKVGASIDAIRAAATDSDSSTDLRFMVSQNDETLDTAMTISSTGLVTATSANQTTLSVVSSNAGFGGQSINASDGTNGKPIISFQRGGAEKAYDYVGTDNKRYFNVNSADRMSIDTAGVVSTTGNVAINHSSPNTQLDIKSTPLTVGASGLTKDNCRQLGLLITPGGTGSNTNGDIYSGLALGDGFAGMYGYDDGSGSATGLGLFTGNGTTVVERLQIRSDGVFCINTTSAAVATQNTDLGLNLNGSSQGRIYATASAHHDFNRTTAGEMFRFRAATTEVGSISVTASATAYNTSSDYRLKENLEPLTNALDRIEQLPVYRFNFKSDPEKIVDGFVAHEVSEFVPEAISGTKDGMQTVVVKEAVEAVEYQPAIEAVEYQAATYYEEGDELPEGVQVGDIKTEEIQAVEYQPEIEAVEAQEEITEEQPLYQGIDQSKLVPLLVAAVKELKAKVEALENA